MGADPPLTLPPGTLRDELDEGCNTRLLQGIRGCGNRQVVHHEQEASPLDRLRREELDLRLAEGVLGSSERSRVDLQSADVEEARVLRPHAGISRIEIEVLALHVLKEVT